MDAQPFISYMDEVYENVSIQRFIVCRVIKRIPFNELFRNRALALEWIFEAEEAAGFPALQWTDLKLFWDYFFPSECLFCIFILVFIVVEHLKENKTKKAKHK